MSKVLVTGGLGFIGSHTVDMLIDKGYDVCVIDNLEKQVHLGKKPTYANDKAEYIIGDIRTKSLIKKSIENVDYIIHLAAAVGVSQSFWQPVKYMDVNATGTANIYEAITKSPSAKKRIKKIVVASSKSIYGEGAYMCKKHGLIYPNTRAIEQLKKAEWEVVCGECSESVSPVGIVESKPAQNLNPYALSKYVTERIAIDYSSALNMPTVAFRYFNVFGTRQSLSNPYTGVIAIFLSRLKNKEQPILFEDGEQLRDFIHVSDIARLNVLALEKGEGVYNVGTGKPTSLKQMAKSLGGLLGVDIEPNISGDFRHGDNRHDYANASLMHRDFNTTAKKDLVEGLKELVEWSEKENAKDFFKKQQQERKKYLG